MSTTSTMYPKCIQYLIEINIMLAHSAGSRGPPRSDGGDEPRDGGAHEPHRLLLTAVRPPRAGEALYELFVIEQTYTH